MRVRFPIYAQTLSFLLLHFTILFVLFVILFNNQFGPGWNAIMHSPLGDKVDAVAWDIHRQLSAHTRDEWNAVLEESGKLYGVKFYLFDNKCEELAGEPIKLPDTVAERIKLHHGWHGNEPRPDEGPATADAPQISASQPEIQPAPAPQLMPPDHPPTRNGPQRSGRPHGRFLMQTTAPDLFWIGVRIPFFEPQSRAMHPAILLATASNLWQTRIFVDFGILLGVVAGILALSVLLWWPFAYRITSAISALTAATEKISIGKFDIALKTNNWDEIGKLSAAINNMSERLREFVTGQKRFLGDIAHELCSPIARLQVALEILESTGTPKQEQIIKDIREEIDEMNALINELLQFSKAGLQTTDLELHSVELMPLLQNVAKKLGDGADIAVTGETSLCALAEPTLLERAISNVVRNAVRYAAGDGPIKLQASRDGDQCVILISDCGPGVPDDAINLLGEPFFRPEPSRSRTSGGVGLGLAIVKSCVQSCNGSVHFRKRQPKGLEVEIRLPSPDATNSPGTTDGAESSEHYQEQLH